MSRKPGSNDSFTRGCLEAETLIAGASLSAPIICTKYEVSLATAKRDLTRLELAFPRLRNDRGVRWLPIDQPKHHPLSAALAVLASMPEGSE